MAVDQQTGSIRNIDKNNNADYEISIIPMIDSKRIILGGVLIYHFLRILAIV